MYIIPADKKIRHEYLMGKWKHAAGEFGKIGTRSNIEGVPKEEQLSIDLDNKPAFGIIDRILRWVEHKFKYFFPRYNLFPEVGTKERKIPGSQSTVKYFTSDEQAEYTLYFDEENEDVRLYDVEGKLYNTSDEISKEKKGCVAYVMTLDKRLIVHKHINVGKDKIAIRHSSLAGGRAVIYSGLMKIENGKITYIDNNSGHYKPKDAHLCKAVKILKEKGNIFSEDAKVTHLGNLHSLASQFPLLHRIPAKKEPIDKFLNRMEKKGKNGLNKSEEHFNNVKEYNERYKHLIYRVSSAFLERCNKDPEIQKIIIKRSTMEIFGKSYDHIDMKSECMNITFDYEQYRHLMCYESSACESKFLERFNEDSQIKKMTIKHSIRKIIGASYGHKPKIQLDMKFEHMNVTLDNERDCKRFANLVYIHNHFLSMDARRIKHESKKEAQDNSTDTTENDKKYTISENNEKYTVSIKNNDANKFINNVLQIKLDSIESLENQVAQVSIGV
ncbi:hypothetical protein [Wolbachia endosymbiont of Pentidionis agamae]|uniref:hypothetical protein n=1 Tax=Wolbachia endosymbiont of Pentidionis agamae TaxID=3110435 RepID=UPI002FD4FFAE